MHRSFIALLIALVGFASQSLAQPATQSTRGAGGGGGGRGGAIIERIQQMAGDLKLTDEQKSKLEAIVNEARDEMREIMKNARDMAPEERQQKLREFVAGLRDKIQPILTDEQRAIFEKKMQGLRAGGGTTQPATNAGGNDGAMLRRMRDAFAKLDLSAEQKSKVNAIFTEMETKFRQLRQEAAGDAQALREKARTMLEESRGKLRELLTPEQQEKLRELMRSGDNNNGAGEPPNRERPNRERRRDGSDAGKDSGSMEKPDAPKPSPATQPGEEPKSGGGAMAPPQPGQPAPALALKKLDGSAVQLSSFKGKLVMLAFGSYSSPSFRQRAEALEQLRKDFNTRVTFMVVYTREAHPAGEAEIARNRDADIQVTAQKDEGDRKKYARDAASRLKLGATLAIDSMDDATATAYRAYPNNAAVLIGKDGTIVAYQEWFDAYRMRDAITSAISESAGK